MDMEYQTTLMIKDLKGLNLTPSKMQLHQQDSSMIFQDKKDLKKLWRMDLEVGKVVDEWVCLQYNLKYVWVLTCLAGDS